MNNELIERMAKAIHARSDHACLWEEIDDCSKIEYMEDAKAALKAAREPTQAMLDAGDNCDDPGCLNDGDYGYTAKCKTHWLAMIDAALQE